MALNKKDLGKLHPKERLEKLKEIVTGKKQATVLEDEPEDMFPEPNETIE